MRGSAGLMIAIAAVSCRGESSSSPRGEPLVPSAQAATVATPSRTPTEPPGPLLGTCGVALASDGTPDLDALLDEADRQLAAGGWADAFTCADMAVDRASRSIEAYHLRAAALAGAGHDDAATTAYGMALALDPEDPETLRAVADFYINVISGKSHDTTSLGLELARRGSARATARRRGHADLRGQLALLEAQAWNDLGRSDEAVGRAADAVKFDRGLVDAVHEQGVALFNLGRFGEAVAAFEQVLAARPDDAYAHNLLALTLESLGRGRDAEVHFAQARALAPDEFAAPVVISVTEMRAEIDRALAGLTPEQQARAAQAPIEIADLPDPADLVGGETPFPPTILGLFRGLALGEQPAPGEQPPTRAIILYRLNLARAVRSRADLSEQIERTLRHELGHLDGLDEDDLRRRDLE